MEYSLLLIQVIILSLFYQECLKPNNILYSFKITLIGLEISNNKYLKSLGKILGNCILCNTFHISWVVFLLHYFIPFYINILLFSATCSYITYIIYNFCYAKKELNDII